MHITVFGGSGATGIILIEKALNKGYMVTAMVRTPAKIKIEHSNLNIMAGELTETDKIEEAIHDADAVISLLGPTPQTKGLVIADGVKNIINAMEKKGVKRLIATATPSFKDSNDKFQFGFSLAVFMIKNLLKHSYNNIVLTGKCITESGLDWTLVRLPMLSDKPARGKIIVGYPGDGKVNLFSLSRADLADFLLQQLNEHNYIRKAPTISN